MASGHGVDKPRKEAHPGRQVGRDVMLPRLSAAMQRQGILSQGEAQSAIGSLKRGDPYGGGEAVSHYGGASKLATDAFRNRDLGKVERYSQNIYDPDARGGPYRD